jgi:hypothetical protein
MFGSSSPRLLVAGGVHEGLSGVDVGGAVVVALAVVAAGVVSSRPVIVIQPVGIAASATTRTSVISIAFILNLFMFIYLLKIISLILF